MDLLEFYNNDVDKYAGNIGTDKGTTHDYLSYYYNSEFTPVRNNQINLLEIGVYFGGSILLWLDWFTNGKIYGIDIGCVPNRDISRAELHMKDAYDPITVSQFEDNFFDYIIDDGPHSVESQVSAISLWVPKLKPNGKLIIEDVAHVEYLPALEQEAKSLNCVTRIFDSRKNKNRADDIIFEVTKA